MLLTAAWWPDLARLSRFRDNLSLTAFLDIIIVAFLIYQMLLLIRGTRATQMLVGVGTIVFLYYASRWWNLTTVHWLLTTLLPYFVFALLIIFQSEIRRALARLGRNPFLSALSHVSRATSYDDILLAASYFSQHKIGALVAVERDIGLRTYIESGIQLDALLSYDLLVAIFRPGGPLHDGAVIVQKDKIAAAACFLPLSVNPKLGTQLGTRHRAAIGVTEETDAIVVVVSEQTAAISVAVGGTIEQDVSLERLRVRLGELTGGVISPSALPSSHTLTDQQASSPAEFRADAGSPAHRRSLQP